MMPFARADEKLVTRAYRLPLSEVITVADRGRRDGSSIRDVIRELDQAPFESRFLKGDDQLFHLDSQELGLRGKESVLVYSKANGCVVAMAKNRDHLTLEEVLFKGRYQNQVMRFRVLEAQGRGWENWNVGIDRVASEVREIHWLESVGTSRISNLVVSEDRNFRAEWTVGELEDPFGYEVNFAISLSKSHLNFKSTLFLPPNQKRVIGVYSKDGDATIAVEVELGFRDPLGNNSDSWIEAEKEGRKVRKFRDLLAKNSGFDAELPGGRVRRVLEGDRGYRDWLDRAWTLGEEGDDPFDERDVSVRKEAPWYDGDHESLAKFCALGLLDLKPYLRSREIDLGEEDYAVVVKGEPVLLVQASPEQLREIEEISKFTFRLDGMVLLDVRLIESAERFEVGDLKSDKTKVLKSFLSHQLDYVGEEFEFSDNEVKGVVECRELEETGHLNLWFDLKSKLPVQKRLELPKGKWVRLRTDKVNGRWRSWVARWSFRRFDRD